MGLITKKRFIRLTNKLVIPEIAKVDQLIEYITSTTEIIKIACLSDKRRSYTICRICGVEDRYDIICFRHSVIITYFTRRRDMELIPRPSWYDLTECGKRKRWDDPTPIENRRNPNFDQLKWSLNIGVCDCEYEKSCDYKAIAKSRHIADIFGVDIRWCIYKDRE